MASSETEVIAASAPPDAPAEPGLHVDARPRPEHPKARVAAWIFIIAVVLIFSDGWIHGRLTLDGPGHSLWVGIALDHWWQGGIPWWLSEMWSGTPGWGLAPTLPVLSLVPIAALIGAEPSVRVASVLAQVLGGIGAFVLARSIWKSTVPSVVAGVIYALHPIILSFGILAGSPDTVGVLAATPWLIWTVTEALRGRGRRWIAISGLLGCFCLLEQAEYMYGLIVFCGALLLMEMARARERGGWPEIQKVLKRAAGISGIAAGASAYWLIPLSTLKDDFFLTPERLARFTLTENVGAKVGQDPGLFMLRAKGLHGVVAFDNLNFLTAGAFYVGIVCTVLTVITAFLIARRRDQPMLTVMLMSSLLMVWGTFGGVSMMQGSLANSSPIVFILLGVLSGVVFGGFLHHLGLGRVGVLIGVAVAASLALVPYVAPFLAVQPLVPLLRTVRFPRLLMFAPLGLALGAAYPLTRLPEWISRWRPALAFRVPRYTTVAAALVLAAFFIDIAPYHSFYFLRPPSTAAAYAQAAATLKAAGDDSRVATGLDPRSVEAILTAGREESTGWPHPVASNTMWHLTAEALYSSPTGYRDAALGLSGTGYYVWEIPTNVPASGGKTKRLTVEDVSVTRNPKSLPLVRTYDSALVVDDPSVAPDLAVLLSQRHIAVVKADTSAVDSLNGVARGVVNSNQSCPDPAVEGADVDTNTELDRLNGGRLLDRLTAEVSEACALNRWVGAFVELGSLETATSSGGVFKVTQDGLTGISLWLDRPPANAVLTVREIGAYDQRLGPIVSQTQAIGLDENDMPTFPVNPFLIAKGKTYAFTLDCGDCSPGQAPRMAVASTRQGKGDLVTTGHIDEGKSAAFVLHYGDLVNAAESSTAVQRVTRPSGSQWDIDTDGDKPSLVVVSAAWFSGWKATVDGKPAPVYDADGGFLGIPVTGGKHHLVVEYQRPVTVMLGRVVSVGVLGIAGAMLLPAGWRLPRRLRRRKVTS